MAPNDKSHRDRRVVLTERSNDVPTVSGSTLGKYRREICEVYPVHSSPRLEIFQINLDEHVWGFHVPDRIDFFSVTNMLPGFQIERFPQRVRTKTAINFERELCGHGEFSLLKREAVSKRQSAVE